MPGSAGPLRNDYFPAALWLDPSGGGDPWSYANAAWARGPGGMGVSGYDSDYSGGPGGGGGFTGRYYGALGARGGEGPQSQEEFEQMAMMKDIMDATMGRGKYDRTAAGGGDNRFDPGRGGLGGGPLEKGGYAFGLGYGPGNQDLRYVNFESDPHPVSMYDHPYNPEMWDDQNFGPSKFRGPGGIHDYLAYDSGHRQKGLRDIGKERHSRETVGKLDRLFNKMKRRAQGHWGRA